MIGRSPARWLALFAVITSFGRAARGQESEPGSLGDVARQTRAQRAADLAKSEKAQQLADEMQREQEASDNAPVGFTSYDAGDYRLFVPTPYSLEGRDNGGAVLLGSRLGVTNTEVMAGTPVPLPSNLSDADLANFVRQIAQRYSQSAYCSPMKLGARRAFRCGLSKGSLLGHDVWGSLEFVVGSSNVVPVMCVSPDDLNQCVTYSQQYGYQTCTNRNPSWQEVQNATKAVSTRFDDERTTANVCDQIIYPSIQLKEDIVAHPANITENKSPKPPVAAVASLNSDSGTQEPSLAEMVRHTRQVAHAKAQATLDNAEGTTAPAGYQSVDLQYCQHPQQCHQISAVVPEQAEQISTVNGQYVYQMKLSGERVLLLVGPADVNAPYRSQTDLEFIRMRDLANPNGWSRQKTDDVSTQELTIEGRPALTTRFRYKRDEKWWVGERTLIDMKIAYDPRGYQLMIGCTAPEEGFADAEALCTTLLHSLRIP